MIQPSQLCRLVYLWSLLVEKLEILSCTFESISKHWDLYRTPAYFWEMKYKKKKKKKKREKNRRKKRRKKGRKKGKKEEKWKISCFAILSCYRKRLCVWKFLLKNSYLNTFTSLSYELVWHSLSMHIIHRLQLNLMKIYLRTICPAMKLLIHSHIFLNNQYFIWLYFWWLNVILWRPMFE